jgi:negative regulator of flagellin synthesis FlgM
MYSETASMAEINNIKPTLQPDVGTTRNVSERGNRTQATEASQANTQSDKVSLSDALSQLEQTLAEVPEVDSAKVEAIKNAIEDGSYQIDSQELARKMIDFEGDL